MKAIMLMLFTFCFAYSTELLVNGDFEQDLTVGWSEKKVAHYSKFSRDTGIHPDPDYEVTNHIATDCFSQCAYLFQRINAKNMNMHSVTFSIALRLRNVKVYNKNIFSASAAIVTFRDEQGQRLGDIKIFKDSSTTTSPLWPIDSNQYLHEVFDTAWHMYSYNLGEALSHIPGITPSKICFVEVGLLDTCYYKYPSNCKRRWVSNEAEVSADSVSLRYDATGTASGQDAFIPPGPVCRQKGNTMTIASSEGSAYRIRLIDLTGGLVFSEILSGGSTHRLPMDRFPKGFYLLQLLTTGKVPVQRAVIIK